MIMYRHEYVSNCRSKLNLKRQVGIVGLEHTFRTIEYSTRDEYIYAMVYECKYELF